MSYVIYRNCAHKLITSECLFFPPLELDTNTRSKDGTHTHKLANLVSSLRSIFKLTYLCKIGSRPHEDSQEICQSHNRTLLPEIDPGLRDQQAYLR